MKDKDLELISALANHFNTNRETAIKFEDKEFDEKMWEESLALGYSDDKSVIEDPPVVVEGAERLSLKEKDILEQTEIYVRGVFEGSFITLKPSDN